MRQRRWLCADCGREWLDVGSTAMGADPWLLAKLRGAPEMGCPACGSEQISEVEFQPTFPGGDIPRESIAEVAPVVDRSRVAQEPALVLVAAGGVPEFD